MVPKKKWLGLSVLIALVFGSAVVFNSAGFGQGAPSTSPLSDIVPFTRETSSQITSLKPAPSTPRSVDDLKAIQDRVQAVFKQVLPATVGLRIRNGPEREEGSGVIVSKDGYVLTAGHVSGKPGTDIEVILSNGRSVWGKALGANNQIDSGMIKIDNKTYVADYPYVPLGSSDRLSIGQWVVALGHPGGYQANRPPVLRIGRVLYMGRDFSRGRTPFVQTDCELIMGDSGGPVFDLDGRLVAINSRIGVEVSSNLHVPIDAYTQDWQRLATGEQWGNRTGPLFARAPSQKASLGLRALDSPDAVVVQVVTYGKAADKAGLKQDDIITKFDGKIIKTMDELGALLARHKPGDAVPLEFKRDGSLKTVTITLDGQP